MMSYGGVVILVVNVARYGNKGRMARGKSLGLDKESHHLHAVRDCYLGAKTVDQSLA